MALFWAIIEIERALFVSFYCISTQDRATFGQSEIRRDVFVHTATMQHSKGMLLKQENLQKAFLCLQHYLSTWKDDIGTFHLGLLEKAALIDFSGNFCPTEALYIPN